MTTDIIKEIKETENAAEERIKAAHQKSKDIIMCAEQEAEHIIKAAEDQAIFESRKKLEYAEKEANLEAESKRKQNDEMCKELKQKAEKKMEEAVNIVMERIVSMNGNS